MRAFLVILILLGCAFFQAQSSDDYYRGAVAQPAAGGAGGPFVFVKSAGNKDDASGTTLATNLVTVTAGHLIVAAVKYEGAVDASLAVSDGTTTFTAATTRAHANNDLNLQFFYLPSSVASGTVTYTATWSGARSFKSLIVFEYNPTGTATFDTQAVNSGTTAAPTSGNITTTAADSVVLAAYANYSSVLVSLRTINGTAVGQNDRDASDATGATTTTACVWANVFTSTFTGDADATLAGSGEWVCNIIAFK